MLFLIHVFILFKSHVYDGLYKKMFSIYSIYSINTVSALITLRVSKNSYSYDYGSLHCLFDQERQLLLPWQRVCVP